MPTPNKRGSLADITPGLVNDVRAKIVEELDPIGIYVIGSVARDETNTESDIDLVIVDRPSEQGSTRDVARRVHRLFRGWRLPMDVIVLTPEEFERGRSIPGHAARIAQQSGDLLHAQHGFPQ